MRQLSAPPEGLPALLPLLPLDRWVLAWAAAGLALPPPPRAVLWPLLLLPPLVAWPPWLQAALVALVPGGRQLPLVPVQLLPALA